MAIKRVKIIETDLCKWAEKKENYLTITFNIILCRKASLKKLKDFNEVVELMKMLVLFGQMLLKNLKCVLVDVSKKLGLVGPQNCII